MGLEVWKLIECLRKVVWVAKVVKEISASPFRLDSGSMRINNGLKRGTLKMGVNHIILREQRFVLKALVELVVEYQYLAYRLR